jgi:hypothetical protein
VNLSLTSMVQRVGPKNAASGKTAKRKKHTQSDEDSENENIQTPPQSSKGKKTRVTAML